MRRALLQLPGLIAVFIALAACSVATGPAQRTARQAPQYGPPGATSTPAGSVRSPGAPAKSPGTTHAMAERTLDATPSRVITAFVREGTNEDDIRDLAISVGQMPGVESSDAAYGLLTITVGVSATATAEQLSDIKQALLASGIVTRVE